MTHFLEKLSDHARHFPDETRRHAADGVVHRRIPAFSGSRDERRMLAETTRQSGERETRVVGARLSTDTEASSRKDGVRDVDERGLGGDEREVRVRDGVRASPIEVALRENELGLRVCQIGTYLANELAVTVEPLFEFGS